MTFSIKAGVCLTFNSNIEAILSGGIVEMATIGVVNGTYVFVKCLIRIAQMAMPGLTRRQP